VAEKNKATQADIEDFESLASTLKVPVRKIWPSEEDAILDLPRAQKRTATYKKAVFVGVEYVYKGPYSPKDIKLRNNLMHTALVELLEQWLGVPDITVRPYRELLRNQNNEYYLVADNLGDPSQRDYEVVSSKIETNIKVIKRGSFLSRMSESEEDSGRLPDSVWVAVLQHLYVIYLLGIGDYGSHNILLSTSQSIVGIDLEEMRGEKVAEDKLDALFKKLSTKQRQLYSRYLPQIQRFEKPLEDWQEQHLASLGCNKVLIENLQDQLGAFLLLPD
jgi:hypothetical protein